MIIGIDIGGTKISAALLDGARIVEQRSSASPIHDDLTQLLPTIQGLLAGWTERADGIGVGCTGLVGERDVHFMSAGADKVLPLKAQLSEAFALPVLILNDAWAAAWGEYRLGEHDAEDTLVYVTVSTGIGGGIIQNGQLQTSRHGFSAHIGHLTVPRSDGKNILCTCGRWNCVEAVASGTAISRRASDLLSHRVSCREVFEGLDNQSELDSLIEDCAEAVAEMIANIKAITGTELIVLGGSVGLNEGFRRRIKIALAKLPEVYAVKLALPKLGKNADIIGAALALQDSLLDNAHA
jgi:N-acylmannosamine kinase